MDNACFSFLRQKACHIGLSLNEWWIFVYGALWWTDSPCRVYSCLAPSVPLPKIWCLPSISNTNIDSQYRSDACLKNQKFHGVPVCTIPGHSSRKRRPLWCEHACSLMRLWPAATTTRSSKQQNDLLSHPEFSKLHCTLKTQITNCK